MATKEQKMAARMAKQQAKQALLDAHTVEEVVKLVTSVADEVLEQPEEPAPRHPERTAPELAAQAPKTMAQMDAELLGNLGMTPEQAAEQVEKAAGQPILHVKQGLALRGGRGEWYKLLCKYDGKPVADYVADGKANPASHYTARSTKCGQPKTPESRLSWFKRAGIVTIS